MSRDAISSTRGNGKISHRLQIKYDVDALLKLYEKKSFRLEDGEKELDKLIKKYGDELFNDLLKRLENWDKEAHEGLLWVLSYIDDQKFRANLLQFINNPNYTFKSRIIALSLLKEMGEDLKVEMPTSAIDFTDLESIMAECIHFMLDAVQQAKGSDEIQNILFQLEDLKATSMGGEEFLHFLIDATFARADPRAADFLQAMSIILPTPETRKKARSCFQKLRLKGIQPQSKFIQILDQNQFFKAYQANADEGSCVQLAVAWDRENELVQVFVFLIDQQEMLDFFVTQNISKTRFEKEFNNELVKAGGDVNEITPTNACQIIGKALLKTKQNEKEPPLIFQRFHHVIESFLAKCQTETGSEKSHAPRR